MEFLGLVITAKGGGVHGFFPLSGESTPEKMLFVTRRSFAAAGHVEAYSFLTKRCPMRFGLSLTLLESPADDSYSAVQSNGRTSLNPRQHTQDKRMVGNTDAK